MLCLRGKEGNSRELAKTIRVNVLFEKCGASRTLAFSSKGQACCWDSGLGTGGRGHRSGPVCILPRTWFGRPQSVCGNHGNGDVIFRKGCGSLGGHTCSFTEEQRPFSVVRGMPDCITWVTYNHERRKHLQGWCFLVAPLDIQKNKCRLFGWNLI